jgi:hypothetical protein
MLISSWRPLAGRTNQALKSHAPAQSATQFIAPEDEPNHERLLEERDRPGRTRRRPADGIFRSTLANPFSDSASTLLLIQHCEFSPFMETSCRVRAKGMMPDRMPSREP